MHDPFQPITAEVPVLVAKACELLIEDLTERAWCCAEAGKRKGIQVKHQFLELSIEI